jgi:hypothetical protein
MQSSTLERPAFLRPVVEEERPLFDWPVLPPPPELSPDARRTARQRALLEAGIHPATREPLETFKGCPTGATCGDCTHAVRVHHHDRRYWKCDESILGRSRSAASDIRVGWPACVRFIPSPRCLTCGRRFDTGRTCTC